MTAMKPALTVRMTSSTEFAPPMMAMDERYTGHEYNQSETPTLTKRRTNAPAVCIGAINKLLAKICAIFAPVPVLPANARWSVPTSKCPSGAETQEPYTAILSALLSTLAFASAYSVGVASLETLRGSRARWEAMISWTKQRVPVWLW